MNLLARLGPKCRFFLAKWEAQMRKKTGHSPVTNFRLPPALKQAFEELAARKGMTPSALLRSLIAVAVGVSEADANQIVQGPRRKSPTTVARELVRHKPGDFVLTPNGRREVVKVNRSRTRVKTGYNTTEVYEHHLVSPDSP